MERLRIGYEHRAQEPYAYAVTDTAVRLVLKVARGVAAKVQVAHGDRYASEQVDYTAMVYSGSDGAWDYYTATIDVPTRRLRYAFVVDTAEGSVWIGEHDASTERTMNNVYQIPYICRRDLFELPEWVNQSVVYQIFPERFANGNPALTPPGAVDWAAAPTPVSMHGGDLPGVIGKLDYLAELGVSVIYLTPIFQAASNHKYDTTDYLEIDPQFGTKDDLRELVSQAHSRGIRVILDAVFNHTGEGFGPFQDAVRRGPSSPHWDWFFITGDAVDLDTVNYETFANRIRTMPKVNMAHLEAENYFLDVAAYWARDFDIDGWRLDVANEIDHVFWRRFRSVVKTVKPDALIIGEVWHDSSPWLRGDQFDSVMNYWFREITLEFFIRRAMSTQVFAEKVVRLLYLYPTQAQCAMFNLLGSHDTERVLTLAAGDVDRVVQALVFQFTYPGMPMIYYGDEVGMEGGGDPDCRRGMEWNHARQNHTLHQSVRALAGLKRAEPALHGVRMYIVEANADIFHFRRFAADGQSALAVAFAMGTRPLPAVNDAEVLFTAIRSDGTPSARVWRVDVAALHH